MIVGHRRCARLSTVRGAVVPDREHPRGGSVGLLPHDLGDAAAEEPQPRLPFAAAKGPGIADIPGGPFGPGAAALIWVRHAHAGKPVLATGWDGCGGEPGGRLAFQAGLRGFASPSPCDRSTTLTASRSHAGSRGKTPVRCDPGRIAASVRQRHRVLPPIEATPPRPMTSRRISGRLERASGRADSYGSRQARASMATTRRGGHARWAPGAGALLQTPQTLSDETLAPLADHLARRIEAGCDRVVREPRGSVQHDLRPDDVPIR
jgi:hypothetical protein